MDTLEVHGPDLIKIVLHIADAAKIIKSLAARAANSTTTIPPSRQPLSGRALLLESTLR
jgi:hypothetical protein